MMNILLGASKILQIKPTKAAAFNALHHSIIMLLKTLMAASTILSAL